MIDNRLPEKTVRYTLGMLLLIVALNAFGGGYYGMAGAKGIPEEWLKGSPFSSYFVPSLVLFVVVGGMALFAAIMVFRQRQPARKLSFASALIILVWLASQVAIIGYVSWMQPSVAITAFIIIWLSKKLPEYGH